MKVIVDTVKPTVLVRPLGRKGSAAGVSWEVQDENLRLNSLAVAYQSVNADANDWRLVPLQQDDYKMAGSKVWDSGLSGPIRVRVSIKDRAGNERAEELLLLEGSTPTSAMAATQQASGRPGGPHLGQDPPRSGPDRRGPLRPGPARLRKPRPRTWNPAR